MTREKSFLPLVEKYFERDAVGAAHSLEAMDEEDTVDVVKSLPVPMAVEAVKYLSDPYAAKVLQKIPEDLFREIVDGLESQQVANIFLQLPQDLRQLLIDRLEGKKKKGIRELLTYPEDSAGRIMTTDFLAFHSDLKMKDAIQRIRVLAQKKETPHSYVYVMDPKDRLCGVMNMRDMMLAFENDSLESVMRREVFSINCFMDRETIAGELSQRGYFAAPVVDNENRLLGVVRADELIGDVQEEASEDIQRMFGAGGDEKAFSPVGFSLKTRLPWLHVNLVTAFLAAGVVALFEGIIAKVTVLAVFLPVIAGQGGNAGAQSLAVVIRGLVMREIPPQKVRRFILKESGIGAVNGLVIGLVAGVVAWFWAGNPYLGFVIFLGMMVNLVAAGFSGAAIPIAMKAVGLDPAQCSSIILTTVTDVVGFFAFLGFAVLFQAQLV